MKKKTLLWLDDIRNPKDYVGNPNKYNTIWVSSYETFTTTILTNGLPDVISFDHDLGCNKSGYDAIKWLANYCIDNHVNLPACYIHSANPVGRANMQSVIDSFEKVYGKSYLAI